MGWGSPCWQGGEQASALALGSQMEQLSLPSRSWLHRSCGSGQQSPDSLFFQPARTSMLVSPVMLRNNCSHKSTPNAEARYASALMMDAGVFRAMQTAERAGWGHAYASVMKINPGSHSSSWNCKIAGLVHAAAGGFCGFLKVCDSQPAWRCLQTVYCRRNHTTCSIPFPAMVSDAQHGSPSCNSRWW